KYSTRDKSHLIPIGRHIEIGNIPRHIAVDFLLQSLILIDRDRRLRRRAGGHIKYENLIVLAENDLFTVGTDFWPHDRAGKIRQLGLRSTFKRVEVVFPIRFIRLEKDISSLVDCRPKILSLIIGVLRKLLRCWVVGLD